MFPRHAPQTNGARLVTRQTPSPDELATNLGKRQSEVELDRKLLKSIIVQATRGLFGVVGSARGTCARSSAVATTPPRSGAGDVAGREGVAVAAYSSRITQDPAPSHFADVLGVRALGGSFRGVDGGGRLSRRCSFGGGASVFDGGADRDRGDRRFDARRAPRRVSCGAQNAA